MAGIPTGFKGKQPGDRERKRVIGGRCVCVCVSVVVVGVIMRDFKIRMDGLLEETTGFSGSTPKKIEPGVNKCRFVLSG